ncbi:biotin-dependent carboxyltransferase family protein [Aestuariibacter sp. AA17]|uniref:Biotin-dependent carboxyltransferase family protein n=1 Tax=Fluctibacter corallii TaxID=2984329 RepID=A0ABT3A5H1_9ALTE|nr:biotin-dependent carboxyltransferase family protein [Aestuariibacter sp. AA17]MCV2883930.1 biotin-dependent carboxyltransferase family protein [Aestuariibacter sp. AA17]
MIEIISVSGQALIVGAQRERVASMGITAAGASDQTAFNLANRLCSNDANSAGIEILFGSLSFIAHKTCFIAVTGAMSDIHKDHTAVAMNRTVQLDAGSRVDIACPTLGMRAYLAVSEGFDVPAIFGSPTTSQREKLGGVDSVGSLLKAGDKLPLSAQVGSVRRLYRMPLHEESLTSTSLTSAPITLRVVEGFQAHEFSPVSRATFYASTYTVTPDANRMGVRLQGAQIGWDKRGLVSEGITRGAVQIPPNGQPIVMMAEYQTIGGYPKLGSVFSHDVDKLAQCRPGDLVVFSPISIENAHNLLNLRAFAQRNIHLLPIPE